MFHLFYGVFNSEACCLEGRDYHHQRRGLCVVGLPLHNGSAGVIIRRGLPSPALSWPILCLCGWELSLHFFGTLDCLKTGSVGLRRPYPVPHLKFTSGAGQVHSMEQAAPLYFDGVDCLHPVHTLKHPGGDCAPSPTPGSGTNATV